jgi:hypothetical protein
MNRCTKAIAAWADEQMRAQQTENEQALYDQLMRPASYGSVIGGREDSDAADPYTVLRSSDGRMSCVRCGDAAPNHSQWCEHQPKDSDAAEPANLHEYPGDEAVASADRFARGCLDVLPSRPTQLTVIKVRLNGCEVPATITQHVANGVITGFDIDVRTENAAPQALVDALHARATLELQGVKPAPQGVLAIADGRTGLRIGEA